MLMECIWWELSSEDPDIDQLKMKLDEVELGDWKMIDVLHAKYWIMSKSPARWGAVMLWCGDKPDLSILPLNVSAMVIGRPPDVKLQFVVPVFCVNGLIAEFI